MLALFQVILCLIPNGTYDYVKIFIFPCLSDLSSVCN